MKRFIAIIVIVTIGAVVVYFSRTPVKEKLPVINPIDLADEMVDPELAMQRKGYGHTIEKFSFLNQDGKIITEKDVDNKVYVAEYFFTTCQTICPIMNNQMKRVHEKYKNERDFIILSFTVHPEVDTVETMKRYAIEHGVKDDRWHFLTGDKAALYGLARRSFFVLKPAEAENLGDAGGDFIHTNNFVLVDRKDRIRGYYNGTSKGAVDSLIHDIDVLLNE